MKYPLEDLIKIKLKRFEDAVKIFEQKTKALIAAKEALLNAEKKRDAAFLLKEKRLKKLRDLLDKGERIDKILKEKEYLKTLQEKLFIEEENVKKEIRNVDLKEKEKKEAQKILFQKNKDLEKLKLHKTHWKKELLQIEKKLQEVQMTEIGAVRHLRKKK